MSESNEDAKPPQWRPLNATQRRVVGVLVEKAKTTPEQYPLTLNALRNGCNQKSNRFPQMNLDEQRLDDALEELRGMSAVMEVQGGGRVSKFRHMMYEWLGVGKAELAVMAELLLRGAQTIGELRGRAARMEPIADIASLRPVLENLQQKRLIVYLTPPGRGCVVTHNLYLASEMERLRKEHGTTGETSPSGPPEPSAAAVGSPPAAETTPQPQTPTPATPEQSASQSQDELEQLRRELRDTRDALAEFREQTEVELEKLRGQLETLSRDLGV